MDKETLEDKIFNEAEPYLSLKNAIVYAGLDGIKKTIKGGKRRNLDAETIENIIQIAIEELNETWNEGDLGDLLWG